MKRDFLKLGTFLFALSLLSCGEQAAVTNDTQTAEPAAQTEAVTEKPLLTDSIEAHDFGGYTFRYLTLGSGINATTRFVDEMYIEKETGDVINDAVYQRNLLLSERLNVQVSVNGTDNPMKDYSTAVTAGENAYDMAGIYKSESITLVSKGLNRDWNTLSVDYSNPWWSRSAVEKLQFAGHQYLMSGSILISEIDDTLALIYNKQIAENHDMEDLYATVSSGAWTVDRFISLCKTVSGDLNGDGKMTPGEDLFGYIQDPASMTNNWFFACDALGYTVDDSGTFAFALDLDRIQTMFDKLAPFHISENVKVGVDLYEGLTYFEENTIFMYAIILRNLELLRDMDVDFGVIPYPKLDEAQENYMTHVGNASPILSIPVTNTEDDERLSVILDAMAIASYEMMIPAYYETALKDKIVRDPESAHMLDIILDARTYDITYIYGYGPISSGAALLKDGKNTFSSSWAKNEKSLTKNMQKLITTITESGS